MILAGPFNGRILKCRCHSVPTQIRPWSYVYLLAAAIDRSTGSIALEVFSSTAQKLPLNSAQCSVVAYCVRLNGHYQFDANSKRLIFRPTPLSRIGNRSAPGRNVSDTRIRPE